MNTFIKSTIASKIDSSFLNTLETYNSIDNLDDLFEAYLGYILQIDQVREAEIQLFNSLNVLTPVAESKWTGPPNKREPKVYSESWLLNYPVQHTVKRVGRTPSYPVFSVPLMDSGTIMGFLNIQLGRLHRLEQQQMSQFHLIGLQLSSNIKEMRLKNEIKEVKEELQTQISNISAIQHQATSLSIELYAISAISTRINQSMDFDQTLHRCLITIRKIFKPYSIFIYTQNDTNSKIELMANDCEDEFAIDEIYGQYMKSICKNYLREVLKSDKPLIKERLAALFQAPEGIETELPVTSLIGVALHSRDAIVGAIMLLFRSPDPINHSGLRLLSGMANIMGMNIENKVLYRQSIQKKSEVDFLFRSIVEFNKTLDLKATLTSVAEKGIEYCGVKSRVYLFSQIKGQVIISSYRKQNNCYTISSSLLDKNEFGVLQHIYSELSEIIKEKPLLIRSIARCRKIAPAAKPWFSELNTSSLVAVPLKVGQKSLGMLLLVRGQDAQSFGLREMQFAEALASAASLTIENARAYTASQEMSDFLEEKISQKTSEISQIQARQMVRVENRKDIIFQVNRHNRFVFANKAMEVLSGLPREILCHKDFRADDVVATEDRNYINSLFRKILAKKIPMAKDAEYHHVNHKGNNHIISLTIFPEYDQQGNVVGVEGVGRDITEEKRLETELKKAKDLALLGEFSGAVAHQMRNPLGNILMGTKRLESALGLDGGRWEVARGNHGSTALLETADRTRVAEILKNLSLGVHNLNQVVTELLEYTKTLKLRLSKQRIDIIMRETVQTFISLLKQNNIKVSEYFQDGLPLISVDAVLIAQVIQNVIYNAIQAMSSGGELTLFANLDEQNSKQLLLSISDTGVGIDPSEINRIFRPFYTTKNMGTGLGLSVAHRIVEAHGGRIQVCRNPCSHLLGENTVQTGNRDLKAIRGTTVHIILPVADGSNKPLEAKLIT
jgi:PAS domain S-box-containing protein